MTVQKPFYSIVMPVFNSAPSINVAIESIVNQTYRNCEIIVVDGASSDDTLKIVRDFQAASTNIRIKLSSEPDKGIYDAMNKGVGMASGDWLYFMGSDDAFHADNVLEDIYKELQKEKVDLIYGNVEGMLSNIKYVYDTENKVLSKGIHHQSVFYAARLFKDLGQYDLKFKIAADYHFTLRVFLNNCYKKKYVNKDICLYGETGLSSKAYDYMFYSYHYKLLALNNGIGKIEDPLKCLETSVYCCLNLAREKKHLLFAWENLIFYLTGKNAFSAMFRMKTMARMLMWNLTPLRRAS